MYGFLNISKETEKFLRWSKMMKNSSELKADLSAVCKVLKIERIELFKYDFSTETFEVLLSYATDSSSLDTVWQILTKADNPNFDAVAKNWEISKIQFKGFWIDVAIPIWRNWLVAWFDRLDTFEWFGEAELVLMKQVWNGLALAYDAWLMVQTAWTDRLTWLWNRMAFDTYVDYQKDVFWEDMKNLWCVAFFDIDHFRNFNNEHGHHVGDMVLRHVSKFVKDAFEEVWWTAFRYGWEEMVWIIPYSSTIRNDSESLFSFIDWIREEVANSEFEVDGKTFKVTTSIWFKIHDQSEEKRETVKKADSALYESKRNWRNRTTEYRVWN